MEEIKASKIRLIASGLIPFAFLVVMILYLLGPGSDLLQFGVALPEITIEKVEFVDSEIHVTVRNTGPISVVIVMADVNDRIQPAAIEPHKSLERFETALVRIPFAWNHAEPYTIGITLDDGVRFEKFIEAATPALKSDSELAGFFAIIGTYVGIIPVMIGLLWLPFIKRIGKNKYNFFLALTVGLLFFLGIDAMLEGFEVSKENLSANFNGELLIITVALLSFLGLYYTAEKLTSRATLSASSKPFAIGLMIAIGIGLHNLGEGLAIGAAIGLGQVALSTFLIVGFALHNTTEGIAIASPVAKSKSPVLKIVLLGLIAGAPTILGTWIGGFFYSPFTAIIFLAIGAGAIFQVALVILKWIYQSEQKLVQTSIISGIGSGMLIMYLTSILV
ncbi:ZIP family metal transporter [Candidatus Nitrosarchaeum limnium]|jgi:ZIP family zinc transporter|uniref:Putative membrane protein n=1 Tax=Candidatus Nitrosarchaeum limnium BG20 TaxID=859192 RepID=S2E861_9ARCH|nr:divalent cation transporter [Candidatus Nitrosarchaeum limnium]EPA05581.1 putative membrane protein [Candidatus Nitrosarchaeum limnium BG20]